MLSFPCPLRKKKQDKITRLDAFKRTAKITRESLHPKKGSGNICGTFSEIISDSPVLIAEKFGT